MSDAGKRSLRTLFQSFLGLIAGGALTGIWNTVMENHQIDAVVAVTVSTLVLPAVVSWAQNTAEDAEKLPTVLPK